MAFKHAVAVQIAADLPEEKAQKRTTELERQDAKAELARVSEHFSTHASDKSGAS